jgi:tetratricopeptide (TPR) repeat protein
MSKTAKGALTGAGDLSRLVAALVQQVEASRVSEDVDDAQSIMFDAWECADPKKRVSLARKALKVSADCADAYTMLAEETAKTPGQAVELYMKAVAAGERALTPAAFVEDVGMFWGLVETRPYMRARAGLAMSLWEAGAHDEAVSHGQEMLRLNPNDNQGMRYVLVNWLQALGRDGEAEALLKRYEGDGGAEFAWPRALAAFRRSGDGVAARKALERAAASNVHVAAFLTGKKKLPRNDTGYVTVGGADEAASYVEAALPIWRQTPGALAWVEARLGAGRTPSAAKSRRASG